MLESGGEDGRGTTTARCPNRPSTCPTTRARCRRGSAGRRGALRPRRATAAKATRALCDPAAAAETTAGRADQRPTTRSPARSARRSGGASARRSSWSTSRVALRDRLPRDVARRYATVDLSWYKATILAEATAGLTAEQARAVEDKVLAKAAGRTPAQHADAVRRAVAQVDPDGADRRRKQQQKTMRLIRTHYGDGMGSCSREMPSEQLDTVWTGCDFWARARKAAGDKRSLDELASPPWPSGPSPSCTTATPPTATAGANPAATAAPSTTPTDGDDGDGRRWSDDDGPDGTSRPTSDDAPTDSSGSDLEPRRRATSRCRAAASTPPTRHGRPAALHALWDLTSLLGLTRHCGELHRLRRDDAPGRDGRARRRRRADPPDADRPRRRRAGRPHPAHLAAPAHQDHRARRPRRPRRHPRPPTCGTPSTTAPPTRSCSTRSQPRHRRSATCSRTPDRRRPRQHTPSAYPAPARLAEFIAMRDRHPTNPTAGPTAASAADIEHVTPHGKGGTTTRDGLTTNVRRWHNLKTHGGWTVQRHGRRLAMDQPPRPQLLHPALRLPARPVSAT